MKLRHVILDRDGVLNERIRGGYVREPQEWVWCPGARCALRRLKRLGLRISIATNQSGIGRRVMTEAQLAAVHRRMLGEASRDGGPIDAIFVCPHAPVERCGCRKPQPGLILAALRAASIPATETIVVGDELRDVEAAGRAGVAAVLLQGLHSPPCSVGNGVSLHENLLAFARTLQPDTECHG